MALTAEQLKKLKELGDQWLATTDPIQRQKLHEQANAIREQAGLRAGVDYDPVSGAALRPGVYDVLPDPNLGSPNIVTLPYRNPGSANYTTLPYNPGPVNIVTLPYNPGVNSYSLPSGGGTVTDTKPVTGPSLAPGADRSSSSYSPAVPERPTPQSHPAEYAELSEPVEPVFDPNAQLSELYRMFQDTLTANSRQMQEWMEMIQEQARRQAQAIAEQKRQALQDLINSLKAQQESALMGITNSLQDAQQALEDRTFQQWLAARQAMANRGLAGSGIASDQDTRLLLAKQRDLAGIFRDAARQRFDVESQIRQSLEQAYRSLAGISDDEIASNIFQSLYEKGRSELMDQARLYADMFSKLLPYSLPTVKDQMDFQLDWAKLASDNNYNWAKLDLDYQRLALDQAKALIDQGRLDLDYWKTLGYIPDPSGKLVPTAETSQADRKLALEEAKARGYFIGPNGEIIPTEERRSNQANEALRGAELVARVNQWAEENKLAAGRLNLSIAEFQHKMDYDQALLDRLSEQLKLDKDRTQLDALKAQLSGVDSQIRAYISLGLEVPPELADARNRIVSQIGALFSSAEKKSDASGVPSGVFKGWAEMAAW